MEATEKSVFGDSRKRRKGDEERKSHDSPAGRVSPTGATGRERLGASPGTGSIRRSSLPSPDMGGSRQEAARLPITSVIESGKGIVEEASRWPDTGQKRASHFAPSGIRPNDPMEAVPVFPLQIRSRSP